MRHVLFCAIWLTALSSAALCPRANAAGLTIVLDFQGPHSQRSVDEMKREFEGIMKDSGVTFDWRLREQVQQEVFGNLVVVRFKGKCILEPVGYLYDERGPLAFTYSTDGVVQPYSQVACDKVTASVRSAMFGGDFARADELLGRALGRVVAHELVHMLSKSGAHGREGIAKSALSGKRLISPELRLDSADLERIHTAGQ
jgi:hypothetical protein